MGRREQNKQRTRRALEQAAACLFEERGFEATTVRDIAAEAGVGERTFFRYFPSKESLILQQIRDVIPVLQQAVRERPAEEPPVTALCNAVIELLDEYGSTPAMLVTGVPVRLGPTVRGDRFILFDLEEAVTEAVLDRLAAAGADPAARATRLRAAVQARAGVSALRALRVVQARDAASAAADAASADVVALVREAFAALDE
ncbi:TetR family transcriptional regulator [Streptomyces sp. RB6PN25]|uniref:TetR family transcriptional regulator n=1 Tax=Streptomyces humicola TaxID=2953240 RepID=A0ABT1PQK9_9ACTN|nr:TetR family transcriptional regulator [Streptomyces humicola]MCQ4079964.1 TetR family transcriptional regulator [Streptomyces humicola]